MTLEELEVYRLAMEIGERVNSEVVRWDFFAKDTIGKQLVRAADSIAANISEGYGRFHFKENRHFNFYSRGSLFETKTWITKAANRKLISKENHRNFESDLDRLGRMLNGYIKSIGNGYGVKEPDPQYGDNPFSNDQFPMTTY
jgi:four helix bundle protein